jgi:hypothetical protein
LLVEHLHAVRVKLQVPPLRYLGFPGQEIRVRSGRVDKVEGGGAPWHEWRWMDRVEKANLDKTDSQPSPSTSSAGSPGRPLLDRQVLTQTLKPSRPSSGAFAAAVTPRAMAVGSRLSMLAWRSHTPHRAGVFLLVVMFGKSALWYDNPAATESRELSNKQKRPPSRVASL